MTLYELTAEYQNLLELAEDPETDPEVFNDTMEGLTGEIEIKAEGYVIVMKELEAQADKLDKEISRLTARKSTCQNSIKRMKESLMSAMQATGKTKLPTEHFKLSIAKNGGVQPMYVTPEIKDIPEEYIIRKPEPDNNKIRQALTEGKNLDFAHLEERGVHLSVR